MNEQTTAPAELNRLAEVVSDDEIVRVHGQSNFGPTMSPRDAVNEGVLKYAIGYQSGHTQLCILLEHGLITKPRPGSYDASLTKKGKRYARALHSAGINLRSFRTQAPESWRPIETAPKDGTWVQAWRDPPSFTGPRWEPLIYARWDDEEESWVWPCDTFEVFTVRGRELADMAIGEGDFYTTPDFTHWMPLPAAPALRPSES